MSFLTYVGLNFQKHWIPDLSHLCYQLTSINFTDLNILSVVLTCVCLHENEKRHQHFSQHDLTINIRAFPIRLGCSAEAETVKPKTGHVLLLFLVTLLLTIE